MPRYKFDISYTKHGELHVEAANPKDAIEIVQTMETHELKQIMVGPYVVDVLIFKQFGRNREDPVVDI